MKLPDALGSRFRTVLRIDRALELVWRSAPGWTVASAALLVIQAAIPVIALYLLKLIVDAVAAGVDSPLQRGVIERVVVLLALAGGVGLLGALCRAAAGYVTEAQGQIVADRMYDILHAKSIEVDLEYYENSRDQDTLHRAQQEAPIRPVRIVNRLIQVGQNGLALIAMAGLLVAFNWMVAVVLLLAAVPGAIARLRYASELHRWQKRVTEAERTTDYLNRFLTDRAHAKEVRLLSVGPLLRQRFRRLRDMLRHQKLGITAKRSRASFAADAGTTIAAFGSYGFIAYQTLQGLSTIGDMFMYFQAFQRAQAFLRDLLNGLTGLYEDNLFLSSFYEFLGADCRVVGPTHPKPVPRPMQTGIAFQQVSFSYPGDERLALKDVSFTIQPGEKVALVGENGSGKTTLVKLLCRLYDPTSGAILLDGTDLREFDPAALRREIAVLFEDFGRYDLTVSDNISFGDVDAVPEADGIERAARLARIHHVIADLHSGYATVLGKRFGNGDELSAGDWQKIGLARAFFREAQIVLLDEPTSAMDPQAERNVIEGFKALTAGRTAVVISHRLSTVKWVDRIYVLANGSVVESGSPEKLIVEGGAYAALFRSAGE